MNRQTGTNRATTKTAYSANTAKLSQNKKERKEKRHILFRNGFHFYSFKKKISSKFQKRGNEVDKQTKKQNLTFSVVPLFWLLYFIKKQKHQ